MKNLIYGVSKQGVLVCLLEVHLRGSMGKGGRKGMAKGDNWFNHQVAANLTQQLVSQQIFAVPKKKEERRNREKNWNKREEMGVGTRKGTQKNSPQKTQSKK